MKNNNLLFFDCETGGLNNRTSDLVEAAWILTDKTGNKVLNSINMRIFPSRPVDPRAAAVNGYDVNEWRTTAYNLDTVMDILLHDAKDAIFVGHNAAFYWGFIEASLASIEKKWTGDYHRLCTASLAWPLMAAGKIEKVRLESLTAYFGIQHEAHRAMGDASAMRQIYLRLMELYSPIIVNS